MPPMKLSLTMPGSATEEFELDEALGLQLKQTVDAHDDFTMGDALRQGIQHVVDHGPMRPSLD